MAKYTLTIQSRPVFLDDASRRVTGELLSAVGHCDYSDDAETNNDFDVTIVSDGSRFSAVIANDSAMQVKTGLRGTAVAGTRTAATIFTRTAGAWVNSAHIGWIAYAYVDTDPDAGTWLKITANTTTALTISGTIPVDANRVALLNAPAIRQNINMIPREGFYGTYFQYKVEKTVPASGVFKWRRMDLEIIPRPNLEPEFIGGFGANQNQWEV